MDNFILEPNSIDLNQEIVNEVNISYVENYETLYNKPSINDVELNGNKTAEDLGLASQNDFNELAADVETKASQNDLNEMGETVLANSGAVQDILDVIDDLSENFEDTKETLNKIIGGGAYNLLLDTSETEVNIEVGDEVYTKKFAPYDRALSHPAGADNQRRYVIIDGEQISATHGEYIESSDLPDPHCTAFYRITADIPRYTYTYWQDTDDQSDTFLRWFAKRFDEDSRTPVTLTFDTEEELNAFKKGVSTTNIRRGLLFYKTAGIPFSKGCTYSIGCYARCSDGNGCLNIYCGGDLNSFDLDGEWRWYEAEYKHNITGPRIVGFYNGHGYQTDAGSVDMCGFVVRHVGTYDAYLDAERKRVREEVQSFQNGSDIVSFGFATDLHISAPSVYQYPYTSDAVERYMKQFELLTKEIPLSCVCFGGDYNGNYDDKEAYDYQLGRDVLSSIGSWISGFDCPTMAICGNHEESFHRGGRRTNSIKITVDGTQYRVAANHDRNIDHWTDLTGESLSSEKLKYTEVVEINGTQYRVPKIDTNGNSKDSDHWMTYDECYNLLLSKFPKKNHKIKQAGKHVFYLIDNITQTAFMFISTFSYPFSDVGMPYNRYFTKTGHDDQHIDEIKSEINVAINANTSNYSWVVFNHFGVTIDGEEGAPGNSTVPEAVSDVIDYIEKADYVVGNVQKGNGIKNGTVITWVGGHNHADWCVVYNNRIPVITCLQSSFMFPYSLSGNVSQDGVVYRNVYGTTDESAFSIFTINKTTRKIYISRFGLGRGREIKYGLDAGLIRYLDEQETES